MMMFLIPFLCFVLNSFSITSAVDTCGWWKDNQQVYQPLDVCINNDVAGTGAFATSYRYKCSANATILDKMTYSQQECMGNGVPTTRKLASSSDYVCTAPKTRTTGCYYASVDFLQYDNADCTNSSNTTHRFSAQPRVARLSSACSKGAFGKPQLYFTVACDSAKMTITAWSNAACSGSHDGQLVLGSDSIGKCGTWQGFTSSVKASRMACISPTGSIETEVNGAFRMRIGSIHGGLLSIALFALCALFY